MGPEGDRAGIKPALATSRNWCRPASDRSHERGGLRRLRSWLATYPASDDGAPESEEMVGATSRSRHATDYGTAPPVFPEDVGWIRSSCQAQRSLGRHFGTPV